MENAQLEGRIHGVSICRWAPTISNLLFADDSLLFCQATRNEAKAIADILQVYAKALGQSTNLEKLSVYFNSNTQSDKKVEIMEILGVKEVERFESYLGLPTLIGRAKYQTFTFLKDWVWKKTTRLERNVAIKGRQGSTYQSGDPIYSHLYYGRIPITNKIMWRIELYVCKILVGTGGEWNEDSLEKLG